MRLRHLVRWAVACAVLLGAAVCVHAMSLRELRSLDKASKQGENYVRYYLVGAMEGVLEAQAHAARAGGKPMICLNSRRLEPHMAQTLFDTELKRNADLYEADMQVTLVMFNALTTVYAC